jgi:hypothetical protein
MVGEMQASVQKQSGMATLVPPHFSNASIHQNATGGVNGFIAVDEVDIDFGTVLKPEKKAQTIKLRNISKILDDQLPMDLPPPDSQELKLLKQRRIEEVIDDMQDLEDDDIHVTSGCGIITMTLQSEKPEPSVHSVRQNLPTNQSNKALKETIPTPHNNKTSLPSISKNQKVHRRQRSRSNGSSSNGGAQESRSRSLGKATFEDIQH